MLNGERRRRNGEVTEIKSVVDEMITLDASASGSDVARIDGDFFCHPRVIGASESKGTARDPGDSKTVAGTRGFGRGVLNSSNSSTDGRAAMRLNEAWCLLEASEAARRRLQQEMKRWIKRVARLEEALAAAEANGEGRARKIRLLAARLEDARKKLMKEKATRREAEGRAEALR